MSTKKGKAKPSRCTNCGAFLPNKFIFLPDHVPDKIRFSCSKCGAVFEKVIRCGHKQKVKEAQR